jgi:hypothetical protein
MKGRIQPHGHPAQIDARMVSIFIFAITIKVLMVVAFRTANLV